MRTENSMLMKTAEKAVATAILRSSGVAFKQAQRRLRSTMRKAVHMRMPARAARGMKPARGANRNSVAATAAAENRPDMRVAAPAK